MKVEQKYPISAAAFYSFMLNLDVVRIFEIKNF